MKNERPVARFRAGAITAAVWRNSIDVSGRKVSVFKATVERGFKDPKTDEWRNTGSFGRNDLPLVVFCLERAFAWMIEHESKGDENEMDEDPRF